MGTRRNVLRTLCSSWKQKSRPLDFLQMCKCKVKMTLRLKWNGNDPKIKADWESVFCITVLVQSTACMKSAELRDLPRSPGNMLDQLVGAVLS